MKKNFRKAMAIVLSLAMVVGTFAFSGAKVDAATLNSDDLANIAGTGTMTNLALGKTPEVYPKVGEGNATNLTNGSITGGHCALGWTDTENTDAYAIIDLGDVYKSESLDEIIVAYNSYGKGAIVGRNYKVYYSPDKVAWTQVREIESITAGDLETSGATAETGLGSVTGRVRYIKIDYPRSTTWGVQLTEIAVLADDPELAPVQTCDDPDSVAVSSSEWGKVSFNITAGQGQEGYTYAAFLDSAQGTLLNGSCEAGVDYTYDVPGGNHVIFVQSHYGDAVSPGISSSQVTVYTYEYLASLSNYNYAYGKDFTLDCGQSAEGNGSITNGTISSSDFVTSHKAGDGGSWHCVDTRTEEVSLWKASSFETVAVWFRSGTGGTWPQSGGLEFQYSPDGDNWTTVATITQSEFTEQRQAAGTIPFRIQADVSNATGNVRYVRVYFPNAVAYGAQITEFGVFDIDGDAEPGQQTVVENPDDFTAVATDYNTVSGVITAGQGQENYKYNVTVDGTMYAEDVNAGSYTITGVPSGTHEIVCKSHYDGAYSSGLTVSNVKVMSREDWYADEDNVATAGEIVACSSFYNDSHTLATAQHAIDGDLSVGEGSGVCYRSGSTQPVTIDIQLAKPYQINNLSKVLVGFSNPRTYAANATISVSSDGENFTEVASDTGYTCTHDNSTIDVHLIEVSDASTDFFQYVRISLTGGQSNWGYVVNEIGIIASEGETPDNYMDVTPYKATTPATAPTKAGKIFAGWFEDAAFTTPYMGTTGYAYAKFIDEKALTVKFQTANDDSAVRFVSTIDNCLDYQSAGFKFTGKYGNATITEKTKTVNSVYETIKADGNTLTPSEAFENDDSAYFFTYTVRGMTDASTASTWSVTPFFVTPDGTTVEGTQGTYPPSNN